MKNENNEEFGRTARQSQSRFLTKKFSWENFEPLTLSELAERNFWQVELRLMVMASKGNLIIGDNVDKQLREWELKNMSPIRRLIERVLYPFGR